MGLSDGDAVVASRHQLAIELFPGMQDWRNTVVTKDAPDGPEYVVRIWMNTPADQPRPTGTPDRVYVVKPLPGHSPTTSIEQVHPKTAADS